MSGISAVARIPLMHNKQQLRKTKRACKVHIMMSPRKRTAMEPQPESSGDRVPKSSGTVESAAVYTGYEKTPDRRYSEIIAFEKLERRRFNYNSFLKSNAYTSRSETFSPNVVLQPQGPYVSFLCRRHQFDNDRNFSRIGRCVLAVHHRGPDQNGPNPPESNDRRAVTRAVRNVLSFAHNPVLLNRSVCHCVRGRLLRRPADPPGDGRLPLSTSHRHFERRFQIRVGCLKTCVAPSEVACYSRQGDRMLLYDSGACHPCHDMARFSLPHTLATLVASNPEICLN